MSDVAAPWSARTPEDAAGLMRGYTGQWWMAGGWAIEAFTGIHRAHADCDPSILRRDLPRFVKHLGAAWEVWAATDGELTRFETWAALPSECLQVWLRRGPDQLWEYDVLLSSGDSDTWMFRRDPSIQLPWARACWTTGGIRYLRPEVQLLFKAKNRRPKDELDFETVLPLLDDAQRRWLASSLDRVSPGHPWRGRL